MSAWEELLQVGHVLARDALPFPDGDNKNETIINGFTFNLTTLEHWNYTLFDNDTISNGSKCYLMFLPYIKPTILENNGSWTNATKCYSAVLNIGPRGNTGIALAAAFGLGLVLTLTCLTKHGRLHLPVDRRFYPIGRRWQWYWACFVCAAALISLLINVDVDRYYLQELPIIVTVFFWFLICNGTLGLVWEAVRHWGSWQERQYVDPNPFVYKEGDRRWQTEFWMPLFFYFWNWMNFFLVVPRNWNFLRKQGDDDQVNNFAIPQATSPRFKAAAFCLFISWLTICFSLWHSIKWYRDPRSGFFRKPYDYLKNVPLRLLLLLLLSLGTIGYQVFISFEWEYSVMKYNGNVAVIYGWGYGPSLLIIYLQIMWGWILPNEDRELLRQRRERGELLDRELGIVHKPAWWSRVRGDHLLSLRDKILRNVHEVGTERGIGRREETDEERAVRLEAQRNALNDDGFELSPMSPQGNDEYNPRSDRAGVRSIYQNESTQETQMPPLYQGKSETRRSESVVQAGGSILFPNYAAQAYADRQRYLQEDGPPPPPYSDQEQRARAERRQSSSTTGSISNQQPQQIRSMLDI